MGVANRSFLKYIYIQYVVPKNIRYEIKSLCESHSSFFRSPCLIGTIRLIGLNRIIVR